MKIQFGTRTILLATAFAAVCLGGVVPYYQDFVIPIPTAMYYSAQDLGLIGPVVVPMFFATYVAGRRALSVKIVIAFAIAEAASWAILHGWVLTT